MKKELAEAPNGNSSDDWRLLAKNCAFDSIKDLATKLKEAHIPITDGQARYIHAMLYAVIVASFQAVAEEAVQGKNVRGALCE